MAKRQEYLRRAVTALLIGGLIVHQIQQIF
jgi:hypothetical protein